MWTTGQEFPHLTSQATDLSMHFIVHSFNIGVQWAEHQAFNREASG